jgi:hypothetical protein
MGWLWVGNMLFCSRCGINVQSMLKLASPTVSESGEVTESLSMLQDALHITAAFTTALAVVLCLRTWGDTLVSGTARPFYQALLHPFGAHAVLLGLLFCPAKVVYPDARWCVCRILVRTITAPTRQVAFVDIIFADCLTSMARGLSALEVLYCLSHTPQAEPTYGQHVMVLHPHCSSMLLAVMMAAPYWWRLQQCLRRWGDTQDAFPHLANALKYCTAFPLIIVDRLGTMLVGEMQLMTQSEQQKLWFACALLNGMYCFVWDVTMDWGLSPEMGFVIAFCTAMGLHLGHGAAGIGLIHGLGGGLLAGLIVSYALSGRLCRCSGGRSWGKPASGAGTLTNPWSKAGLSGAVVSPWFRATTVSLNLVIRMMWVLRLVRLPAWFPEPGVTALIFEILELCRRSLWINLRLAWEQTERELVASRT